MVFSWLNGLFVRRLAISGVILAGPSASSPLARAGAKEDVIIAAMNLSEAANYSWTSTISYNDDSYEISGMTQHGGYTWQRMPMIKSIARRVGRDGDADLQVVFKDGDRFAILAGNAWKTLDELPRQHRDWVDDDTGWYVPVMVPSGPDPSLSAETPSSPWGQPAVVYVPRSRVRRNHRYPDAPLELRLPHHELGIIVSSQTGLEVAGNNATGSLSELGAYLLLARDDEEPGTPLRAAGTFKLRLRDGVVGQYSLDLAAAFQAKGGKVVVRRQSRTIVSRVGATNFSLTEALRRKLEP